VSRPACRVTPAPHAAARACADAPIRLCIPGGATAQPGRRAAATVTLDTFTRTRGVRAASQPAAVRRPPDQDAMTSTAELSSPASAHTGLTRGVTDPDYTLDHKYTRTDGRIYLSGVQALVRLPLMQRLRDQAAGL